MMTKEEMFARYVARDASDAYIVGFIHHEMVYIIKMNELPERFVKLNRTSSHHHGIRALRMKLTTADKESLLAAGAEIFGKAEILQDARWNKGQMLQKLIMERAGQTWRPDNKPFWEGGDVVIDGVDYQVKFDGAQLVTENGVA